MKRIILILIAMLLLAPHGISQIINVPGDQPSIQAAIDAASDGDTVLVEEDSYFENINFYGKPITIASRFILDGDTSHISRTIIDGSQSTKVDTGSVVLMNSMEDTTSVLMGFTITGGTGSVLSFPWQSEEPIPYLIGGGIAIVHAGGKIVHNIIEHNTVESWDRNFLVMGGAGIFAIVSNGRTAIIRDNIIRNNLVTSDQGYLEGGGAAFALGPLLVENNQFIGNTTNNPGKVQHGAIGGGFSWDGGQEFYTPDTIREVIFRNNVITHNQCFGNGHPEGGGGVFLGNPTGEIPVEFYNNVVAYNYATQEGGGVYIHLTDINFINNTIFNNQAVVSANNLLIENSKCRIFNNVICSDTLSEEIRNIEVRGTYQQSIFYNLLSEPFNPREPFRGNGNSFLDPELESDNYMPGPTSPAVGRGIDTMWINTAYYVAPAMDINGDPRPSDSDEYVDVGAIESEFTRYVLSNADLAAVGIAGHYLDPPFHRDTLEYLLVKSPGVTSVGRWNIYAADALATMEIDTAADLFSEDELDRTTKILVTSSDSTTQKEYTVIYQYLSSDATLAGLEVSMGTLSPSFDPSILDYYDTIPYGMKLPVPEVICITSDSGSTVGIKPAQDIYSQFEVMRTTTVLVTSPNNLVSQEYTIFFTVDLTRPSLTLLNDSVDKGNSIGFIVSEPGTVYMVPENTPAIYDSIMNEKLVWTEVSTDTAYLSTEGMDATGTFWLYESGKHQSISESQEIILYSTTKVSESESQSFRVYPNPADDILHIQISREDTYDISITSAEGHLIYQSYMQGKTHELDLSSFQKGVYFITVRTKDSIGTKRIIKL